MADPTKKRSFAELAAAVGDPGSSVLVVPGDEPMTDETLSYIRSLASSVDAPELGWCVAEIDRLRAEVTRLTRELAAREPEFYDGW